MSERTIACAACLFVLSVTPSTLAQDRSLELPVHLPRYNVDIDLDVAGHIVRARQRVTWINPHATPTDRLVFNAHSRYVVPADKVGFNAKMLEILRVQPSESLGTRNPPLHVKGVFLVQAGDPVPLGFHYEGDTKTTLVVDLPHQIAAGQSVTVILDLVLTLPQKQGRWGQWDGVTTLSNWLPVLAFYGERNDDRLCTSAPPACPGATWQPTLFIPWHQPFFNESGIYDVTLTLPAEEHVASTGHVVRSTSLDGGRKRLEIQARGVREFTLVTSSRFQIYEADAKAGPGGAPVKVRVLAFPEHEFYAKHMVRIASEALENYSRWFCPYPWKDFTIAECYFGWNGNECSTLVMIDQRVFAMPHVGVGYVEYLVSHEVCHQWWYNLIGTNGYCETWMDEAMASYFTHRFLNRKLGKNNALMTYPAGLEWLPNIRRDDYRSSGMYGTIARGENGPVVRPIDQFGHLVNLFNMCYDKGSRIVGMVEERMLEAAFLDFIGILCRKYRYRILRVADFRRELENHTRQPWDEFFAHWVFGSGLSDWSVEKVEVTRPPKCRTDHPEACPLRRRMLLARAACPEAGTPDGGTRIEILVHQKGEFDEPTSLGIALPNSEGYPIRIPILPRATAPYRCDDPPATITPLPAGPNGGARMKVELVLPTEPDQIAIDPDRVLIDRDPANNFWHTAIRWRVTPLYTFLEETDLTNAYDRWNILCGPWIFSPPYQDAWFTRSTMFGVRAGAYRTQQFQGGAYAGYRTDFRDVVAGIDGLWDHWPFEKSQTGVMAERRLAQFNQGDEDAFRAVFWTRYIFGYGSSLYLPPMHYVEGFAQYSDNFLPFPTQSAPRGVRYDRTSTLGMHYRINHLTPYWDPEGGFQFDAWYEGGIARSPSTVGLHKISSQLSVVKYVPDLSEMAPDGSVRHRVLSWLGNTRIAVRGFGAQAFPLRGEFFPLGSAELFRGFDMAQRQGSGVWVGSVEWRVPVLQRTNIDCVDHVMSLRNSYAAFFYDVGNAYANGRAVGPIAHAVGVGARLDVSWFSFVERTTLRLDVAKAINSNTGFQVWLGVNHPF